MTSKSKVATDNTQPSSLGESIEVKGLPSVQSAAMTTVEKKTLSTMTIRTPSVGILTTGKNVSEKSMLAAQVTKAVLLRLEKDGLIRRFKVLLKGTTTVKEIQIVFSPEIWTDTLDLRLLSKDKK